jgi:hypothetical protein
MTFNTITKSVCVTEPGAVFASGISSQFLELKNYKYIDFIVSSGAGTAAETTVTVKGKNGEDGTAKEVEFKINTNSTAFEDLNSDILSMGGTAGSCGFKVYRVSVDNLESGGFDRVNINLSAVTGSTVIGCIVAVMYEPRYTE